MTDNEQRIAIAETCGWKKHREIEPGEWVWIHPITELVCGQTLIPDYLNDLNAMHEAEKHLTEKQQVWYLQKLTQVRFKAGVGGMIACMIDKTTFATAPQRAEAFLRTIGKWVD